MAALPVFSPCRLQCDAGTWVLCMEYSIDVVNVEREVADQHYRTKAVYTLAISNGFAKTHADVVLTEAGAAIIEQKGKDPQTAGQDRPGEALEARPRPF
jgi:hypothetical protein